MASTRLGAIAQHLSRPHQGCGRRVASCGTAAAAADTAAAESEQRRVAAADTAAAESGQRREPSTSSRSAQLHGMGLWMDVMRDMEHLYEGDYETTFDAWQRGGVVGLVIGPMLLDAPDLVRLPDGGTSTLAKPRPPALAFDADPAVYEDFGVSVPQPESEAPYFAGIGDSLKTSAVPREAQLRRLHEMLAAAKRRGFSVMIFQAQWGAPDDNEGTSYNGGINYDDNHHLFDLTRRRASIARIVDTLQQFPEADGFIWVRNTPFGSHF